MLVMAVSLFVIKYYISCKNIYVKLYMICYIKYISTKESDVRYLAKKDGPSVTFDV